MIFGSVSVAREWVSGKLPKVWGGLHFGGGGWVRWRVSWVRCSGPGFFFSLFFFFHGGTKSAEGL